MYGSLHFCTTVEALMADVSERKSSMYWSCSGRRTPVSNNEGCSVRDGFRTHKDHETEHEDHANPEEAGPPRPRLALETVRVAEFRPSVGLARRGWCRPVLEVISASLSGVGEQTGAGFVCM